MIFQVENKNVHASDAGQGIDPKKQTIVCLQGSGMSHIVWSLTEQFFANQNFNVMSLVKEMSKPWDKVKWETNTDKSFHESDLL